MKITHQLKAPTWRDEAGTQVPAKRITKDEKLKEQYSYKIATEALKLFNLLLKLKADVAAKCTEILEQHLTANEIKESKGNLEWYSFDRSIKIQIRNQERIEFDSLLIEQCKLKLMEIVGESIKEEHAFIKELVESAFQTSKGKLDTKKILGLRRYSSRIKDQRYAEAMELLDRSIRRPESKTYYQVWVMNDKGQYKNIDLNFSSIELDDQGFS